MTRLRRAAAAVAAVGLLALALPASLGGSHGPQAGNPTAKPTVHATTAPVSKWALLLPSGYAATYEWGNLQYPAGTGYYVTLGGTRVADTTAAQYTFANLACGTTYSFGVQAHDGSGHTGNVITESFTTLSCTQFPLKVSPNGKYIENAYGDPWLMVGDSPWTVIGNLDTTNSANYFADRERLGFNTSLISLLCDSYISCVASTAGKTYDGIWPFTGQTSLGSANFASPNSTYFSRAHTMIAQAQADGIEVMLDPLDTGNCGSTSWFNAMVAYGTGQLSSANPLYAYGQYLGTEFGDLKNIIWMSGNDFQCYTNGTDNNDAISIAMGIANTDPSALQTVEIDYASPPPAGSSTSLFGVSGASTHWASDIQLNQVYTYAPTYATVRAALTQSSTQPVFLGEANYEGQQNTGNDGCGAGVAGDSTARICRLQEWWTMTSGATGQVYGGNYVASSTATADEGTFGITNGFTNGQIDTTGATELGYVTNLMQSIKWWTLKPDTTNAVVTAGVGTCPTTGTFGGTGGPTCVTTASDYAGAGTATVSVSYLPDPSSLSSITVNLADFAGSVTAQWYDPTNGQYATVSGSPFTNSGTHSFTPTGNNHAGDKDWVLLLTG